MLTLSIIIPIYNIEEEYMRKCINSILNQDIRDVEVILVDDGSTNGCERICDEISSYENRIKVIHQKNSGVSVARNVGVSEANAKYIVFVDPDDWLEEGSLLVIKNSIAKYNADITIYDYKEKFREEEIKHTFENKIDIVFNKKDYDLLQLNILNCKTKFKSINTSSVWAKCYKKEFLLHNNIKFIENQKKSQDTIFNLEAIEKAEKIVYCNNYIYNYRQSNISVCHKMNKKIDETLINAVRLIKKFIIDNKKNYIFIDAYYLSIYYIYNQILNLNYFHKDNKERYFYNRLNWKRLIEIDELRDCFKNLDQKDFRIKDRVIILLTRKEQYFAIHYMFKIKNYIKNKKNNNFE